MLAEAKLVPAVNPMVVAGLILRAPEQARASGPSARRTRCIRRQVTRRQNPEKRLPDRVASNFSKTFHLKNRGQSEKFGTRLRWCRKVQAHDAHQAKTHYAGAHRSVV